GEGVERLGALERFGHIVDNWFQLIRAQWNLNVLTTGIGQANQVVPILVAAPGYFDGFVTLGNILQLQFAYGQVAGALTWFVNAYQEIARWRANIERLSAFAEMMDRSEAEVAAGGVQVVPGGAALKIQSLRLDAPRGRGVLAGGQGAGAGRGARARRRRAQDPEPAARRARRKGAPRGRQRDGCARRAGRGPGRLRHGQDGAVPGAGGSLALRVRSHRAATALEHAVP